MARRSDGERGGDRRDRERGHQGEGLPAQARKWRQVDNDFINKIVGVPWEVYPGVKGSGEIRSRVRFPHEPFEVPRPVRGRDEYIPRRLGSRRVTSRGSASRQAAQDAGLRTVTCRRRVILRSAGGGFRRSWRRRAIPGSSASRSGRTSTSASSWRRARRKGRRF